MGYLSIKKYPGTGEQAFLDADHTKLNGIETSATADQTGAEIVALLEALGVGSRLSHTKLDDIGASDHHAKYTDAEALTQAKANIEDAPVDGHTEQGISSNWAFDHAAASHGSDKHTDVSRELFIPAQYADGDGTVQRYVDLPDGVQKTETFLFKVPDDYVYVQSLKFKYVDCVLSSGNVVWSMYKWHFSVDEGITSNSSSDTNNVRAVAQGSSLRSVIASVLFTGLAKGDYVSLEFRREGAHASDTLANNFTLAGILFAYMAEQ